MLRFYCARSFFIFYLRMQPADGISLNRLLSQSGICSRREADEWIEAGRVTLNGQVARKGNRAMPQDIVLLDGKPLPSKPPTVYILLHKPRGIVCTGDERERNNVISFLDYPQRVFYVGRLDKDSEGLLLLTNDGDIVNKILRAANQHEKEYIVDVDKPLSANFLRQMAQGVPILDTITRPCLVEQTAPRQFRITLTQGLNRQIRRMCERLGYEVQRLRRIRIMHLHIDQLPRGAWRTLRPEEIERLHQLTELSESAPQHNDDEGED